jgi:hypothetical protein
MRMWPGVGGSEDLQQTYFNINLDWMAAISSTILRTGLLFKMYDYNVLVYGCSCQLAPGVVCLYY